MSKADSLLSAVRKVATASGLPWPHVQRFYAALQESSPESPITWLPKSTGRNIALATPDRIANLLIALAAARSPDEAKAAVMWAAQLAESGRKNLAELGRSPFADAISRLVADADAASQVERIELNPVDGCATITCADNSHRFSLPPEDRADHVWAPWVVPFPTEKRLIETVGIIDGHLIRELSTAISWSFEKVAFRKSPQDVSEDADG
ncbi:MAG: hypothetical protein ACM3W4_03235 [Ignavibacteriales bacterium]